MSDEWWYRLDANDRVVEVGGDWDGFAAEAGAPGASSDAVVGKDFFSMILGSETKQILRAIMDSARETGRPLEVPFRCDVPGRRRFMVWRGEPLADGGLLVRTRLDRQEERAELPFARIGQDPSERVRMCSWCHRVAVEDAWVEPESAARRLGLLLEASVPTITHGICPECSTGVSDEISAHEAA